MREMSIGENYKKIEPPSAQTFRDFREAQYDLRASRLHTRARWLVRWRLQDSAETFRIADDTPATGGGGSCRITGQREKLGVAEEWVLRSVERVTDSEGNALPAPGRVG